MPRGCDPATGLTFPMISPSKRGMMGPDHLRAPEDFMPRLAALLIALLLPAFAAAQEYPTYDNIWVNDQADVIGEPAEERITAALQTLADETGVQATVLTMHTRWGYPGDSLESFATGLFNDWGIGDATRNDGILVLVLTTDREMRIELGSGYPSGYDAVAKEIIDDVFIPAFGKGDFEAGIEAGTLVVADRIAREHAAGNAPAPVSGGGADDKGSPGFGLAIMAIFGAVAVFGRRIVDRFRRCPSCGQRGLDITRETLRAATKHSTGSGRKTVHCPHCGYQDSSSYTIARRSSTSSSGGSFGGGSSSGGGASGRW